MRSVGALLSALLVPVAVLAQPGGLASGRVVEKVVTQADPGQSYALYIPTSYQPDRKWPILYAFDARGNGKLVAERFWEVAEQHGYLVASSNNSASDGPAEPNVKALRAMWADTHARFSIDDRRVYAAGFSGTVRFACQMALAAPGTIAGVIGAGAGFPFEARPTKDTPFVFFGAVGDRDFNYYEVMDLADQLTALGLPHRVEVFAGAHEWMPKETAARAIAWMDLQAMKRRTREKDAALVETLWSADLLQARALEASGDLPEAYRLYAAMSEDYRGLYEPEALNGVAVKLSEIAASEAYKKEKKLRQERNQRDKEYVARAPKALATTDLAQALKDLRIQELKKQRESADPQESLSARRLLGTVLVQTSYYLPRMFTEQGNHDRAVFALSIAAEIVPDNPEVWFELAAAHARKGSKKRALENLRKAVDKGWADLPRLEGEAAFAGLRQDKGYQELAAEVAKRKPA